MKRKILLMAMIASVVFVGCKQKKSNEVEIGTILPLTGYASSTGEMFYKGIQLALEEIQQSDPDLFEVYFEDCKSSPKDALTAYRKLASKGVKYYIGFGGQFILGYAGQTNNTDKLLLTSGVANDNLLSLSNRCLRFFPTIEEVTDEVREFVVRGDYRNVAIVYMQNEAYSMYADKAHKKIMDSKKNVVLMESYDPNVRDFRAIVNKIKQKNVDLVYFSGLGDGVTIFTKQLFDNPETKKIPVIGDMNYSDANNLEKIGNITSSINAIDSYIDSSFINKYKKKYNQNPNAYSAYGYTILYVLKEALMERRDNQSVDDIYNYIINHQFTTVAGIVQFDSLTKEPQMDLRVYTFPTE